MAEPVRAYLEQIGRYALLRPEQEVELARLVQRAQQLEQQLQRSPTEQRELRRGRRARERMIQANLRLVVTVAKTYQGRGLDLMDLVQEGSLGLIRAVEKFDPTLGYRFSTYASPSSAPVALYTTPNPPSPSLPPITKSSML